MIITTFVCTIVFSKLFVCHDCGYRTFHNHFPPHSAQLQHAVESASRKLRIQRLNPAEWKALNSLLKVENNTGNPKLKNPNSTAWGLPQGLVSTYRTYGVKYGTACPSCQMVLMIRYVKAKYSGFQGAWRHWNSRSPRTNKKRRYY